MFVSYYWDIASGPAIILLGAAVFGAIYLATGAARGSGSRQPATPPLLESPMH
jgi:hypothetical protein